MLVVISGGGYLADSFAAILVPDFAFTFSLFTFVGEALLIIGLFWRALRGFSSGPEGPSGQVPEPRLAPPTPVAS